MTTALHLQIIGKGHPLIMLHGWGWHSGIWQPLIPQLAEKFQLFLFDLPGMGKSSVLTEDYSIENIAALLLDAAPDNATWLGWSLGGMIAWYIAIHYPERVSRLITVGSSPKFISAENWPGVAPHVLEKFSRLLIADYQQTLQDFLELQLRGAPQRDELLPELKKQIAATSSNHVPALLGGLEILRTLDLRADLNKMQCRSLHMFGSHDTLVPVGVVDQIQTLMSSVQTEYEIFRRAGHMPFLSQAGNFLKKLLGTGSIY